MSPYTALGFQTVRKYQPIWNFELELKPISLAAIMVGAGNKSPAAVPSKKIHMLYDLDRNSKLFDFNISMPTNFLQCSFKTPLCQRVIIAAQQLGLPQEEILVLVNEFFKSLLQKTTFRNEENKLNIGGKESDEEFNKIVVDGIKSSNLGKYCSELLEVSKSEKVQKIFSDNNKAALDLGVFGVPTFLISSPEQGIEEFMVFGSDRFEQIAHVCKKPYFGVNPNLSLVSKSVL